MTNAQEVMQVPGLEDQLIKPEAVANFVLNLETTGPPIKESNHADKMRIVPFGATLMMQGVVVPGPANPKATLRTPIQKPTTIQTMRGKVPDVSTDIDISYDQSDPR
jgi:hypothetical protein